LHGNTIEIASAYRTYFAMTSNEKCQLYSFMPVAFLIGASTYYKKPYIIYNKLTEITKLHLRRSDLRGGAMHLLHGEIS
jgi:hypothetical protein